MQADILRIQKFLYLYFKDITLNEQTITQTKLIYFFLRKYFRFNYQLLWSEQHQPAFTAFHNQFKADECLTFIIDDQNKHAYFFKPDTITQQTMDFISFDPRLITENDLHDFVIDFVINRPYRYQQNIQEQQNLFTNNDNYDEDSNNNEEYMFENQSDIRIEDNAPHIIKTMQVSIPLQNLQLQHKIQTGASTNIQFVRIPTGIVSPRQNSHDPQSYFDNISTS